MDLGCRENSKETSSFTRQKSGASGNFEDSPDCYGGTHKIAGIQIE